MLYSTQSTMLLLECVFVLRLLPLHPSISEAQLTLQHCTLNSVLSSSRVLAMLYHLSASYHIFISPSQLLKQPSLRAKLKWCPIPEHLNP